MNPTDNTTDRSSGEVNGQAAQFEYDQTETPKLKWTIEEDGVQKGNEIGVADVIALIPTESTVKSKQSKLLYVERDEAADEDTKKDPVRFQSLIASNLPRPFVQDFFHPSPGRFNRFEDELDKHVIVDDVNHLRCKVDNCAKLWAGIDFWRQHVQTRHPDLYSSIRSKYPDNPLPKIHAIVSTGSGTGLALQVWESLVEPFLTSISLHQSTDYTLHITQSPSTISDLTTSQILPAANSGHPQVLILLSGDGGPIDLLNSLLSLPHSPSYLPPTLILLPLGTGNALSHSSGLPSPSSALSSALLGSPQPLPFFTAKFSPGAELLSSSSSGMTSSPIPDSRIYGAVVCSWGLHATLVADSDTPEFRRFGAERFKLAAKEALFPSEGGGPHVYLGEVKVKRRAGGGAEGGGGGGGSGGKEAGENDEWEEIREGRGEHAYILATLVAELEKGFRISPASQPLDGKLRLLEFGAGMSGEMIMRIMGGAYQGGKHVEDGRVGYGEIEGLRIEFREKEERWRRVCVDGKIVRVEEGGWVEVRVEEGTGAGTTGTGKGVLELVLPRKR